ncbi:TlpA family protein disulfide reductase [Aquimarina sp. D1M17]|uniref:TlpA disulfide reductase family protein n=1 Tax=Aquimarina acroporae TaxID=2937283 RepID=UPI0020BFB2FB|nr:TlpA disulfide reductase family protein [Aquimarina acroporae]MCK8524041.1 TlpA family protein disulfide reductase [Aquimarina acroporae]
MIKEIFKILLGIVVAIAAIVTVFLSLRYAKVIYEFSMLRWIAILACILGFYLSGRINKNTSLKLLPVVLVALVVFKPFRYFYFPFIIVLLIFAITTLLLTRHEIKNRNKKWLFLTMTGALICFMFSQPLILQKENFRKQFDGTLVNASIVWDFAKKAESEFPSFTLVDPQNNTISLSNFRDKTLFVNFWATWCAPCLREKPTLDQIKDKYTRRDDVVFIDISIDHDVQKWRSYIDKNNPKGFQLNTNGNEIQIMRKLGFSGIPFHVLVNSEGLYKQNDSLQMVEELLTDTEKLKSFISDYQ